MAAEEEKRCRIEHKGKQMKSLTPSESETEVSTEAVPEIQERPRWGEILKSYIALDAFHFL